jgi:hypothetical protein
VQAVMLTHLRGSSHKPGTRHERPKFMHWNLSVEPLLEAAQWTAIVFAGMLAVMFLTWSLEVTASQNGVVISDYDQTSEINPTF